MKPGWPWSPTSTVPSFFIPSSYSLWCSQLQLQYEPRSRFHGDSSPGAFSTWTHSCTLWLFCKILRYIWWDRGNGRSPDPVTPIKLWSYAFFIWMGLLSPEEQKEPHRCRERYPNPPAAPSQPPRLLATNSWFIVKALQLQ